MQTNPQRFVFVPSLLQFMDNPGIGTKFWILTWHYNKPIGVQGPFEIIEVRAERHLKRVVYRSEADMISDALVGDLVGRGARLTLEGAQKCFQEAKADFDRNSHAQAAFDHECKMDRAFAVNGY